MYGTYGSESESGMGVEVERVMLGLGGSEKEVLGEMMYKGRNGIGRTGANEGTS